MAAKELLQNMRRGSFVLPFLGIQFFALVAMVAEFRSGRAVESSEYVGVLNPWLLVSSGPFWMVVAVVCTLLMPMGGLALMGQELDDGNHELLALTKLGRWKIVVGKLVALWGLSLVTFISLLPYVVVRYLVGGIEWWHEAACAGTVLGLSAMIGAGAIGASAFRGIGSRVLVMMLYLFSMVAGSAGPLIGSAMVTDGCGIFYHFTALSAVVCYTVCGLALACSRLRVSLMAYEVKPATMIVGLLLFAPFVLGMITTMTLGFGGVAGLLGMAVIASRMHVSPRALITPEHY